LVTVPQWASKPCALQRGPVAQLCWTPSQVTELAPTLQTLLPEQLRVCEAAKQLRMQEDGAGQA
jgi:hypothetical protein